MICNSVFLLHASASKLRMCPLTFLILIGITQSALADDLVIHLAGKSSVTRKVSTYKCDGVGVKMGLPAGLFTVEYINGGGNSLAILPISNKSMIFTNVISASGARYAAQEYIWWEAVGRSITLSSDSLAGKQQTTCQRISIK
jgi:membrane-bound inhibitor of C-type lysozyme